MIGLDTTPSRVIQQLLVDLGLATLPESNGEWPVYHSHMPDGPDNALTVYKTEDLKKGRTHTDGESLVNYGIQVRIRGAAYDGQVLGEEKGHTIFNAFDQVQNVPVTVHVNGSDRHFLVHNVENSGGVIHLGFEQSSTRRKIYTLNAMVTISQL